MKELFKISKSELNATVNALCNISSDKSPDIHHCSINIKIENKKLKFICKNFDAYLCIEYDCDSEDNNFVIGSSIFSNLVKKLESEEIEFFYINSRLVIIDRKSHFTLDTIKTDYPQRNKQNFKFICTISGRTFAEKIQSCLLKIENGIFSLNLGKESNLIARDKRRLATIKLEEKTPEVSINLSANMINEIKELCLRHDSIQISSSDQEVLFEAENYFLICNNQWFAQINYIELCRTDFSTEIRLNTPEVRRILKKLKLMASSFTNAVDLEFSHNSLVISVFNPSVGSGKEAISIEHNIKPMKITLNILHFINILQLMEGEEFSMFVIDHKSKVILKEKATYLIMPLSF